MWMPAGYCFWVLTCKGNTSKKQCGVRISTYLLSIFPLMWLLLKSFIAARAVRNTGSDKQTSWNSKLFVIHFVSKQENWEMENINVYEADDLISEIFWDSTSEVLKKVLVLNIFLNSQDDVSRKAHHYLKAFWAPADDCFWRFWQYFESLLFWKNILPKQHLL